EVLNNVPINTNFHMYIILFIGLQQRRLPITKQDLTLTDCTVILHSNLIPFQIGMAKLFKNKLDPFLLIVTLLFCGNSYNKRFVVDIGLDYSFAVSEPHLQIPKIFWGLAHKRTMPNKIHIFMVYYIIIQVHQSLHWHYYMLHIGTQPVVRSEAYFYSSDDYRIILRWLAIDLACLFGETPLLKNIAVDSFSSLYLLAVTLKGMFTYLVVKILMLPLKFFMEIKGIIVKLVCYWTHIKIGDLQLIYKILETFPYRENFPTLGMIALVQIKVGPAGQP
ncbi:hypothetical protein ACJX0J_012587, partial [Zea mays]